MVGWCFSHFPQFVESQHNTINNQRIHFHMFQMVDLCFSNHSFIVLNCSPFAPAGSTQHLISRGKTKALFIWLTMSSYVTFWDVGEVKQPVTSSACVCLCDRFGRKPALPVIVFRHSPDPSLCLNWDPTSKSYPSRFLLWGLDAAWCKMFL